MSKDQFPAPKPRYNIAPLPSLLLVSPVGHFVYWSLSLNGSCTVEEGKCDDFEQIKVLQDKFKPDRVVVSTDMRTQEALEAAHQFGWETSSSAPGFAVPSEAKLRGDGLDIQIRQKATYRLDHNGQRASVHLGSPLAKVFTGESVLANAPLAAVCLEGTWYVPAEPPLAQSLKRAWDDAAVSASC
jgi:hypothetical protein